MSNVSQLLAYVRYIEGTGIKEEIFFCHSLKATTKAVDVLAVVDDVFEENKLSWENFVAVCTDGAPAMMGRRSGFVTLVKQKNRLNPLHDPPTGTCRQNVAAETELGARNRHQGGELCQVVCCQYSPISSALQRHGRFARASAVSYEGM